MTRLLSVLAIVILLFVLAVSIVAVAVYYPDKPAVSRVAPPLPDPQTATFETDFQCNPKVFEAFSKKKTEEAFIAMGALGRKNADAKYVPVFLAMREYASTTYYQAYMMGCRDAISREMRGWPD